MDYNQPMDATPLLDIVPFPYVTAVEPNPDRSWDKDDGLEPLSKLTQEEHQVLLRTLPFCAPLHLQWNRYQVMTDKVLRSPVLFLAIAVAAVTAQQFFISRLKDTPPYSQATLSAMIIVTVAALVSIWLHLYQIERINQSFSTKPEVDVRSSASAAIVLLAIIPILSVPVFQWSSIGGGELFTAQRMVKYATLASWSQAVPNLQGSLPAMVVMENEATLKTLTQWAIRDESVRKKLEPGIGTSGDGSISATKPEIVSRVIREEWERRRDGLYMPAFFPASSQSSPHSVLESQVKIPTQILSLQLHCNPMVVDEDDPPQLMTDSDGKPSLRIHARDTINEACRGTFKLDGVQLDATMRNTVSENLIAENSSILELPYGSDFLENYLSLLRGPTAVSAFAPSWSRLVLTDPSLNEMTCARKIGIIALSRTLHADDGTVPGLSTLQMTSCVPMFWSDHHFYLTFLRRASPWVHGHTEEAWDKNFFGPFAYQTLRHPWRWASPDEETANALVESFISDATRFSVTGAQWLQQYLSAEKTDLQIKGAVGAIVSSVTLLRQSFLARLATAAELTLRERHANGQSLNWGDSLDSVGFRLEHKIFQRRLSYRAFLWLWVVILLILTILWWTDVDDAKSHIAPWSLATPAARAMLLRYSSVRPWLRALYTGRCKVADLPSMRIGYWKVHPKIGKEGWRLDAADFRKFIPGKKTTRNNESQETESLVEGDVYARAFIRVFGINATVCIVGFCIIEILTLMGSFREKHNTQNTSYEPWQRLMLLGASSDGFFSILFFRIMPNSLLYFALAWLPHLYYFLCRRQPWINLLHGPQRADKSMLLDYSTKLFPFKYAIKNRQWIIAVLSVLSLGAAIVPSLQIHLHRLRQLTDVIGDPSYQPMKKAWAAEEWEASVKMNLSVFKQALEDLVDGGDAKRMITHRWHSHEAAFAPVSLQTAADSLFKDAVYDTTAIRAGLECQELSAEVFMQHLTSKSQASPIHSLKIMLDGSSPPEPVTIHRPCTIEGSKIASQNSEGEPPAKETICARWWLAGSDRPSSSRSPVWLLTVIRGTAFWSHNNHQMEFSGMPSAMGIRCRSRIVREPARVTVPRVSEGGRGHFDTPIPHRYESLGIGMDVPDEFKETIDRGLNTSNMPQRTLQDGVNAPETLIHTDRFVGDFLSFLLYQYRYSACPACLNSTSLERDASRLFSRFITALSHKEGSGFLKKAGPEDRVMVYPVRTVEKLPVDIFSLVLLSVFVFAYFCLLCAAPSVYKQYYMSPSPEPLLHSLALLTGDGENDDLVNQWTISSRLEKEKISLGTREWNQERRRRKFDFSGRIVKSGLRDLFNSIQSWGLDFEYARVSSSSESGAVGRVVMGLPSSDGGEPVSRYHDSPEGEHGEEIGGSRRRISWAPEM